jgi:hypothetical protein
MFSLTCGSQKVNLKEVEDRLRACEGMGGRDKEKVYNGFKGTAGQE